MLIALRASGRNTGREGGGASLCELPPLISLITSLKPFDIDWFDISIPLSLSPSKGRLPSAFDRFSPTLLFQPAAENVDADCDANFLQKIYIFLKVLRGSRSFYCSIQLGASEIEMGLRMVYECLIKMRRGWNRSRAGWRRFLLDITSSCLARHSMTKTSRSPMNGSLMLRLFLILFPAFSVI